MRVAIIFVFIVIFLAGCNILGPPKPPQPYCSSSQVGFMCSKPEIYLDESNNVNIRVNITNQHGREVTIKKVFCTDLPSNKVSDVLAEDIGDKRLSTWESKSKEFNLKCWKDKSGGNPVIIQNVRKFRGYLFIWYSFEDDFMLTRQAQMIITGSPPWG